MTTKTTHDELAALEDTSFITQHDHKAGAVVCGETPEEQKRHRDFGAVTSQAKVPRYEEKCTACRGSGTFYSYTGRPVGPCFKCKGKGVRTFKTSPQTRANSRLKAAEKKSKQNQEKADQGLQWLQDNPKRAAFLEQDWEFPRSLKTNLIHYGSLTTKQVAAIDRSLEKQAAKKIERNKVEAISVEAGLDLTTLVSGLYAVDDVELEIKIVLKPGKWNGWVFVKTPYGDRVGSQRPGQEYRGAQVPAIRKILENPLEGAKRYGQITGTCGCCGRLLTNPDSIEAGIGPICASKF